MSPIETLSLSTVQPRDQAAPLGSRTERPSDEPPVALPPSMSLDERLVQIESRLIAWALNLADGNKTRAAEILKIKRSTLGDRISRCRLNGYDL